MKILIVASGIPSKDFPLTGIFEFDQAKALASRGIDVYYFAIDLRSIRRKRKLGITSGIINGVKWYSIAIPLGAVPISLLCLVGKYALKFLFRRVFTQDKPNIMHAHFSEIGCMCISLAKRYQIPLYLTEHSSAINAPFVSKQLLKCARYTYSNVDHLIAVSTGLQKNINKLTGQSSSVIHNIIDTELFAKSESIEHIGFRIVTVAGLIPRKRINLLLESINELKSQFPFLKLDIIGDGSHRRVYEQYVEVNNLQHIVTFWGQLSREQIIHVFKQSDCFALVSAVETFGVVYVEAMASGLPVIATRCGGPEDFVNENNGILIDVDDKEALKSAIVTLVKNISTYNRSNIKKDALRFSPETISQQLMRLYSISR